MRVRLSAVVAYFRMSLPPEAGNMCPNVAAGAAARLDRHHVPVIEIIDDAALRWREAPRRQKRTVSGM